MQIAILPGSAHSVPDHSGRSAMEWFDTMARVLLIATIVLIGATLVRNVTDTLTAVTHGDVQTTLTAQR